MSKKRTFMGEEVDEAKWHKAVDVVKSPGPEFWAVSLAAWVVGILIGIVLGFTNQPLSFFALDMIESWIVVSIMAFLGCALFFGRAYFLVMGLLGVMMGHIMLANVLSGLLAVIPMLFSGFAGTLLGQKLGEDFTGQGNVFANSRAIVLYWGIGLISAIILAFLSPYWGFLGGLGPVITGMGW